MDVSPNAFLGDRELSGIRITACSRFKGIVAHRFYIDKVKFVRHLLHVVEIVEETFKILR